MSMVGLCFNSDHDRTVLVIPMPGTKNSLLSQSEKVLDPFSMVSQYMNMPLSFLGGYQCSDI